MAKNYSQLKKSFGCRLYNHKDRKQMEGKLGVEVGEIGSDELIGTRDSWGSVEI